MSLSAFTVLLASCQQHKTDRASESSHQSAAQPPPLPPSKTAEPDTPAETGKGQEGQKASQKPKTAPAHGTPNPGQLDSLRSAMDKLREQEEAKQKRGGGLP